MGEHQIAYTSPYRIRRQGWTAETRLEVLAVLCLAPSTDVPDCARSCMLIFHYTMILPSVDAYAFSIAHRPPSRRRFQLSSPTCMVASSNGRELRMHSPPLLFSRSVVHSHRYDFCHHSTHFPQSEHVPDFCHVISHTIQVFGRRSIMLVQIFLFALGSLVSGVSQSLTVFIVGRSTSLYSTNYYSPH